MHVSVDGQMVELDNVETSLDTTLKVRDLFELVACESGTSEAGGSACTSPGVRKLYATDRA